MVLDQGFFSMDELCEVESMFSEHVIVSHNVELYIEGDDDAEGHSDSTCV